MHDSLSPIKKFGFIFILLLAFSACKGTKEASIPAPNFELESEKGWTWINGPAIPDKGKAYRLFFEAENRYTIYLDVNSCFGAYQKQADNALILPDYAACTEMCCDTEVANVFLTAFHAMEGYAIHGDTLILKGPDQALHFLPANGKEKGE